MQIPYSAIFGLDVSKTAKSPSIWNLKYKELNSNQIMVATDCDNLTFDLELRKKLDDKLFKGGLLAAPLKNHQSIMKYQLSKVAEKSNAVNCFRKFQNKIECDNFDGIAAVTAMEEEWSKEILLNSKIAIFGTGPVARSIFNQLLFNENSSKEIDFFSRYGNRKLYNNEVQDLKKFELRKSSYNILINATKLGSPSSPGAPITKDIFRNLSKSTKYFDCNYLRDSEPTGVQLARKMGMFALDGVRMNQIQARLAFNFVNYDII